MQTGCPMKMVTRIPHFRQLAKGSPKPISDEAKFRLKVIDWYRLKSPRFSKNGKPNVSATCRHFSIHRSLFYRWFGRFKNGKVETLENKSRRPKNVRQVRYDSKTVEVVRKIRKENPSYSAKKIAVIIKRDELLENPPSAATVGRIIKKYNMYYRSDIKERHKRARKAAKAHAKNRVPYMLRATKQCEIIEFDMKHVNLPGRKLYALCAIDQLTKIPVVHISNGCTSVSARTALQKTVTRFGKAVKIVCDNGSENMCKAQEWLCENEIEQLWARPHKPKDKPFIERFIGTLQTECLDYNYEPMNATELQAVVDDWLIKYETYRPHEALGMLTPKEFADKMLKSIPS